MTKFNKLGSNIYNTITANNNEGKLIIISANLIIILPIFPPKYPDTKPKMPPNVIEKNTAVAAINIVF